MHQVPTLPGLLDDLTAAHVRLLDALTAQRSAIAGADPARVSEATKRQHEACVAIADLEQRRRELVVELIRSRPDLPIGPAGQPTLETLATLLAEPVRSEAIRKAAALKQLVIRTRRETGLLRSAAGTLIAHMDGLMIQLGRRLSHAGTYAPTRSNAPTVVSAIDLTS